MNAFRRSIRLSSLCAILAFPTAVWSSKPGTTSANVLKIGVGARAIAMGEAYTAQADDVSSLYWNPAGLAFLNQGQASFLYNRYLEDVAYHNGSIGIPLENGGVGASLSYIGYGSADGRDVSGLPIGDVSAHSWVGTVSGAWLGESASAGASIKMIQETLVDEKATTAAFDLGANYVIPYPLLDGTWRVGGTIQNLGQGLKFISERDPLPTQLKLGVAGVQLLNNWLNVSLDTVKPRDNAWYVNAGAEVVLGKFLMLRAGYAGNRTEGIGLRGGLGLRIANVSFDYAYAGFGDLGLTHRYELSYRFGTPRPTLSPEERRLIKRADRAMANGDYEQAVLLYNAVIELNPRYRPVRRSLSVAMTRMEKQEHEVVTREKPAPLIERTKNAWENSPEVDDLEDMLRSADSKSNMKVKKVSDE